MNEHLISVIIPVYNTAEYLPRCLDSILNNTYKHLEILCINDGSRDNSLEVLNAYAAQDSRIRVIDQENAGVSAARNRGLDEATGEYIAFVDSDDWIHRQYFEVLLAHALHHNADISICAEQKVSSKLPDPELAHQSQGSILLSDIQCFEYSYVIWGRLYRTDVIANRRFDRQIRLSEDTLFNLHILHNGSALRLARCETKMYFYFMRDDSAIHTLTHRENENLIRWYLAHLDTASSPHIRNYYLEKATKHLFVWRYEAMVCKSTAETRRIAPLIHQCVQALCAPASRAIKNKLIYLVFSYFPGLYRFFRILNDPTMLAWEKKLRDQQTSSDSRKP